MSNFPEHPDDSLPAETQPQDAAPASAADSLSQLHVAGAGTLGMGLLLASLSILFLASIAAYLFIRHQYLADPAHTWPPLGMPRVPNSLWVSTIIILLASVTIQLALSAVRRDDDRGLVRHLVATFVIGVLFLILQTINWLEFYSKIEHTVLQGAYLGMFFILTGLHAAHVVGGLIPLGVVIARAKKGRYSRNFYPGVRYVTAYWHFLDVIWVALFCVIYF